jgi:flagellar biosynthesis protein FliQ
VLAPRSAAMVHPEPMSLFFTTLALVLAARMIVRRAWTVPMAIALGAALGAAQLVRAFSLWTFGVVVLVLVVVAVARSDERRQALIALIVTVIATGVVAGPWYAYQSHRYTNPVFDRPQVQVPLLQRRPAAFYANPELRSVFGTPYKTSLNNRFVPQLYTDGWGDYYGVFVWNNGDLQPGASAKRDLRVQMWLAIVPTLLIAGGWLVLLARSLSRRRLRSAPERLLVGLLPLAGIVGMLYFTVSYPTPDGDVVKATYMLTTVPAWALCFGYGVDSVLERRPRLLVPLCILLGLAGLSGLRLALYGSPLGIF